MNSGIKGKMVEQMEIWSSIFLDPDVPYSDTTCAIDAMSWDSIMEEHSDATKVIAEIKVDDKRVYCSLGSPLSGEYAQDANERGRLGLTNKLYIPSWAADILGVDGCGDAAMVRWFSQEAFPYATKIVIRPHDSAFYSVNAKEELERELTKIGVLQQGQQIIISLQGLDGYRMCVDVVKTEPANVVLAEGEEVEIEFEEALDAIAAPMAAPVVAPLHAEEHMTPTENPNENGGHVLGGSPAKRLPDGRAWNPWRVSPKV